MYFTNLTKPLTYLGNFERFVLNYLNWVGLLYQNLLPNLWIIINNRTFEAKAFFALELISQRQIFFSDISADQKVKNFGKPKSLEMQKTFNNLFFKRKFVISWSSIPPPPEKIAKICWRKIFLSCFEIFVAVGGIWWRIMESGPEAGAISYR